MAILVAGIGLALVTLGGASESDAANVTTTTPLTVAPVAAVEPATTEPLAKPTTTAAPEDPVDVGLMAVGDCLELPAEDVFYEFTPVGCSLPHDLEVFAIIDIANRSAAYSLKAQYPGEDQLYDFAFDVCLEEFEQYVGVPYAESVVYVDAFYPTDEGWLFQDDREVDCVLYSVDVDLNLEKTTGSLRNAGI